MLYGTHYTGRIGVLASVYLMLETDILQRTKSEKSYDGQWLKVFLLLGVTWEAGVQLSVF